MTAAKPKDLTSIGFSDPTTETVTLHLNGERYALNAVQVKQLAKAVKKLEAHCTIERPHHEGVTVDVPQGW